MAPGEALFFSGSLWHATRNDGTRMRKALVLQYCATATPARRPLSYRTPVAWHPDPQPCVLVAGRPGGPNPLVTPGPPPLSARAGALLTATNEAVHDLTRRTRRRLRA